MSENHQKNRGSKNESEDLALSMKEPAAQSAKKKEFLEHYFYKTLKRKYINHSKIHAKALNYLT